MKKCTKCLVKYLNPELDFSKNSKSKDGYHHHCKKCVAVYHKTHYENNKDSYKKTAHKHNIEYINRNVQFTWDYCKKHSCVDCGESDPIVLEFDHVSNKEKGVSWLATHGAKLETIIKEIEKCEVRCANCHRRKTSKDFNWYKNIKK